MAKANNLIDSILKVSGNEYTDTDWSLVDDRYIDTGSYSVNALLSASMYKGLPANMITVFAGEKGTGKTFFLYSLYKQFLEKHEKGIVIHFESEDLNAIKRMKKRGIDTSRVAFLNVLTVQQFKTQSVKILNNYLEKDEADRVPMIIGLDSAGNLGTSKEQDDSAEGKETQDMTRARLLKATFRVLTMKLAMANAPLLLTNHIYLEQNSMYPQAIVSGGGGILYSASSIVMLSKKKEKDSDGEVVGNIIHCKNYKARDTRENAVVDSLVTYDAGLSKYYGLVDIALEAGIFESVSKKIKLPDDSTVFVSQLNKNPEKYFTEEVMQKLEAYVNKSFLYGSDYEYSQSNKE